MFFNQYFDMVITQFDPLFVASKFLNGAYFWEALFHIKWEISEDRDH